MDNKIYIAEAYLHYDLQKDLLEKNNNQPLVGIQILDFHTYLELFAHNKNDSIKSTIEIYNRLQNIDNNLFTSSLNNLSFIQEIQSINEELSSNMCKASDIPNDKSAQADLRKLLECISDIPTTGTFLSKAYSKISTVQDFSNIEFVNFSYKNSWEEKIYNYMCEHGATTKHTEIPTQDTEYYYALNKRLECESVAQRIVSLVNNGVDLSEIGIIVSDLSEYKDALSFVMNRYNIPVYIPNNTKLIPVRDFLICFFNYYTNPNQISLENLLSNTFLRVPYCETLFAYATALHFEYNDFFNDFDFYNVLSNSPFLSKSNKPVLKHYEEKAIKSREFYLDFFNKMNTTSFNTLLQSLHQFLMNKSEHLTSSDIKLINSFYDKFYEISTSYPNHSLNFLCKLALHWLDSSEQRLERLSNQIVVGDLHSPSMNLEYGFLLGMQQKNYPAFHNRSGLLNEELIELLPNFLKLSTRYNQHIKIVNKNLRFAKHLIISYPQSNYEGKVNERSLELELEFNLKKHTYVQNEDKGPPAYPLEENNNTYTRTYELDSELAKKIFFDNNAIYGSISSFEKFFECPYKYFLKSGISINNLFSFKIQEAEVGDLQHKFLQEMVTQKGKQYTKSTDNDIENFLNTKFTHYETVFKKDSKAIDIIKNQIKSNLHYVLDSLQQMEDHTMFRPKAVEYHYQNHNLLSYKNIALYIEGYIDRIDEIEQGLRIIDYKSSKKEFKKDKFESGQSLQLMTYVYIATELLKKEVFGVYYYSMNPISTNHIAAKITRGRYTEGKDYTITSITQSDVENKMEINKLHGNTFVSDSSDLLLLDDTAGNYIHNIKPGNKDEKKNGIDAKTKNQYSYEEIKNQLNIIYQYLIDQLLVGNISCTPTDSACKYCEYSSICMFRGEKIKKSPPITLHTTENESEEN